MKTILNIAGSDSSGGAGIQADLKTNEYFGVFGTSAITVLTAQNTMGVKEIFEINPNFLKAQIEAIIEDYEIGAIKIGMLYNIEIINIVKDFVKNMKIPIVLDPVCVSKAGSPLLDLNAINALKDLCNLATIITPNQYEAKLLFNENDILNPKYPILIKKFHINESCVDKLFRPNHEPQFFSSVFLETSNLHGTGCSFSSAIASNLALGLSLEKSIEISKAFIYEAIINAPNLGHGAGVIRHRIKS